MTDTATTDLDPSIGFYHRCTVNSHGCPRLRMAFRSAESAGTKVDWHRLVRNLAMVSARLHQQAQKGFETTPTDHVTPQEPRESDDNLDLSLIEESLAKTPWERILANDDAARFADALRAAMKQRDAKP